jgi:hypothetical protein
MTPIESNRSAASKAAVLKGITSTGSVLEALGHSGP